MGNLCGPQEENQPRYETKQQTQIKIFIKKLEIDLRKTNVNYIANLNLLKQREIQCLSNLIKCLFSQQLKQALISFVKDHKEKIASVIPQKKIRKSIDQHNNHFMPNSEPKKQQFNDIFSRSSCNQSLQITVPTTIQNVKKQSQQQLKQKYQQLIHKLTRADSTIQIIGQVIEQQEQQQYRESMIQRGDSFMSNKYNKKTTQKSIKTPPHSPIIDNNITKEKSVKEFQIINESKQVKQIQALNVNLRKKSSAKQQSKISCGVFQMPQIQNYEEFTPSQKIKDYKKLLKQYEKEKKQYMTQLQKLKCDIQRLENEKSQKQHTSSINNQGGSFTLHHKQTLIPIVMERIHSEEVNSNFSPLKINESDVNNKTVKVDYSTSVSKQYEVQVKYTQDRKHMSPEDEEIFTSGELRQKLDIMKTLKNRNERDHAKSILIRLFRDSRLFPIFYSKNEISNETVQYRTLIQGLFEIYYGAEAYRQNSIEQTNLIYSYDERQPKKYYEYLKDYKCWLLVAKVSDELYIGGFVNLKNGLKRPTNQSFLFSMPLKGKPYILKACKQISDPSIKPDYINFGDSQLRIKSQTKTVHLNIGSLDYNFCQLNLNQSSLRSFSLKFGSSFELQSFEIHQIQFKNHKKSN